MSPASPSTRGDLQIGKLLGEGGMGAVFAAEHAVYGSVVVKEMHANLDQRNRDRFRLEAEALAKVSSPNVVRVVDWGDRDGRPFVVMERLEGMALQARMSKAVRAGTRLAPMEAVDIAIDVLRGLSAVHRQKMVHRDIKPANIFLCADRAVLLDFGLVKLMESVTGVKSLAHPTAAGAAMGTPRYMSPEQARGKGVTAQTDLYAVGAVLFFMLTGEHLFSETQLVAQVKAHVFRAPRKPSAVVGDSVPPALDRAVLKALAKKPANRFASADAFAAQLVAIRSRLGAVSVSGSQQTIVLDVEADSASSALMSTPSGVPAISNDGTVPLLPGDRCGPYTIAREIGRGGMGVVYLAHDAKGRRRAIKTLVFGGHLTAQLAERFSREMLLLSSIESPHMVRFYDAGKIERREGTTMWIALEYLDGRTLRELLTDNPKGFDAETVARWCLHIAEGVGAAHRLHVVHRDLKPENAALSGDAVKVFDLGIAKWQLASSSTAGNVRIGTLAYMAPEQADPSIGPIDERTDVYALGLILHELATGRHPLCPFDDPMSAMEVQLRIVGMVPAPITATHPDFPPLLSAIADRCLHKDAGDRFSTMRALRDALEEVLIRLRTARHRAAFAALGVDAGAAHEAARRARMVSATTPPDGEREMVVERGEAGTIKMAEVSPEAVAAARWEGASRTLAPTEVATTVHASPAVEPPSVSASGAHGFVMTSPATTPLPVGYRARMDTSQSVRPVVSGGRMAVIVVGALLMLGILAGGGIYLASEHVGEEGLPREEPTPPSRADEDTRPSPPPSTSPSPPRPLERMPSSAPSANATHTLPSARASATVKPRVQPRPPRRRRRNEPPAAPTSTVQLL